MDRGEERRLWRRVEHAQRRIRDRVFRTGMAGRYHAEKGTELLKHPSFLERFVRPFDDEARAAKYLETLPRLVRRTRAQDRRCAELWEARHTLDDPDAYVRARAELAGLLVRFRFPLHSYERLARQPHKPVLEQADRLLAGGAGDEAEARALESLLRLTLPEFVALEQATAADLRALDGLRAELVALHEGFARDRAEALAGPGGEAARYALCGLRKAAEYYTHRHGYSFREYAQHWIETAVRQQ